MKLSLSENIRTFRKQRKLTQEKLAEALGVTVGAVYKWESGQSQPELNLLVELADFFDTSVDVLLGYRIKDNSLESARKRINACCQTLDPEALAEAEKLLAKYPHSFQVVYGCATVYMIFGAGSHDRQQLNRAQELFEQARVLLPQNEDPGVNEMTLCGNLSIVWLLLGEKEKSVELLKKNNAGGVFSSDIGAVLSVYGDDPEEAAPYLSDALVSAATTLFAAVIGYVFLFRKRNDWASAMDVLSWGIGFLTGLKAENQPDFQEKVFAELLVLKSYVEVKTGLEEEAAASLEEAREMARRFDSMPDYSLKTMRFTDRTEQSVVFDVFGATASGSIDRLIGLLNDPEFADRWREKEKR